MVLSLLTSSVGVVINQHFCQDELKNTALFAAVQSCHTTEETPAPACPHHQKQSKRNGLDQRDCCNDSTHFLKSTQEQQMEQQDLPVWKALVATPVAAFTTASVFSQSPAQLSGRFYRPPPLPTEPTIQFQIFRL
ncbi:HYC_CC_PP family protein [Flavilitoribacter nigricans]|uniref:HYC_CC_PP family protein n=1 Tax=Flavilitoribacter nigricans TaxID=70997 RepID=UPI00117B68A5|nr:hypothetical protein [Flavilitoribacter nigricans]